MNNDARIQSGEHANGTGGGTPVGRFDVQVRELGEVTRRLLIRKTVHARKDDFL